MNVLMVGGANHLMNQLIRKVKKEGHRIYLLTGSRYGTGAYEKVFERYDLTYNSEHLSDVFESVSPDVTIFMGAFDSNFRWTNEERELVRLTSSLTNLLTSHTMAGKGRFIYLSSDEIYAESSDSNLDEDAPATPSQLKGMALAQCEDICASFRKNRDTDVVVLRLDHFYMIPQQPDDVNDICSQMCLEALQTGKISANSGRRFSLLYDSDAVEFIFKLVRNGTHEHSVYNLSASQELTEMDVARYIQQAMDEDGGITIEEKEGTRHRCILSNQRFDKEFGARIFADTQETVEKVAKYMVAHKNLFLTGEQENKSLWKRLKDKIKWLGGAILPYLENLVFFLLVILISASPVGVEYLQELDLFLLYVLLFATVYGQLQATFSALLAVIGSYAIQLQDKTFLDIAMDYNTYIWIAQLFIVGLVVGYLKDQISKLNLESEEEQRFLNQQLSDIKGINSSNVRVKDALETEIVNQRDSIGKIYRITSRLEQYMPEEVLFYAAEIMRDILGSGDIAIYTVSNQAYARLFVFTSERAKALGKSLRYRELGEVYDAITAHKVYINRDLDSRYPMMANAIYNGDDIQSMIMVWDLPWERMTLGQADMLTIVSYLIQNAVLRATQYIAMLENRRYQEGGHVMGTEAFAPLVHAFLTARNKNLTECALLRIDLPAGMADVTVKPAPAPVQEITPIPVQEIAPTPVQETVPTPIKETAPTPVKESVALSMKRSRLEKKSSKLSAIFNKYVSPVVSGRTKAEGGDQAAAPGVSKDAALRQKPGKRLAPSVPEAVASPQKAAPSVPEAVTPPQKAAVPSAPRDVTRYEKAGKDLVSQIRQDDYIGTLEDGNLYILLSNSSNTDADFVIKRIRGAGYGCELMEDFGV